MEEFIWSHVESKMIVEVCLGAMSKFIKSCSHLCSVPYCASATSKLLLTSSLTTPLPYLTQLVWWPQEPRMLPSILAMFNDNCASQWLPMHLWQRPKKLKLQGQQRWRKLLRKSWMLQGSPNLSRTPWIGRTYSMSLIILTLLLQQVTPLPLTLIVMTPFTVGLIVGDFCHNFGKITVLTS